MARPMEVERVACQGVRNRSTIKVSCDNLASPTWDVSVLIFTFLLHLLTSHNS